MKIGIIGAGKVGSALATLFADAGHEVGISNSRGPESLVGIAMVLKVYAMTPMEAATFADIIVLAIPFGAYRSVPRLAVAGKIVIDAMNYYADRDGNFPDIEIKGKTSSELVDEYLAGARVVKAFNTIHHEHLETRSNIALPLDRRRAIFIAGDDVDAKRTVARLIQEIGFSVANTGGLRGGGLRQQPGTLVYNKDLTIGQAKAALHQAGA